MSNIYTHYPQDDEISRDALIEELESRGVPTKIVYHFEDKEKSDATKREVTSWNISVSWDNGEEENIADVPHYVSDAVDSHLSALENEQLQKRLTKQGGKNG